MSLLDRLPGRRPASLPEPEAHALLNTEHGHPVLYLEDVSVSFDGFQALNKLTMYIDDGELRCIIGPNGAGKTTMMDVITGKTRPDSGQVWFGQRLDLLGMSEPEIARAGIGRKFQKPTVFEQLTVFENLELAMASDKGARRRAARPHRRGVGADPPADPCRQAGGQPVAWSEAVAGDRHAADAEPARAAGGRAGRRHDRRGDRAHGRAADLAGRTSLGDRGRARHGLRALDRAQGDRAASGIGAGRGQHGPGAGRSARDRGLPGRVNHSAAPGRGPGAGTGSAHAEHTQDQPVLRPEPHHPGCRSRDRCRPVCLPDGPQRRGQDHAAEMPDGHTAAERRRNRLRWPVHPPAVDRNARARRHRLCAAGARHLPHADRGGEPARGAGRAARPAASGARAHLSALPGAQGNARPARRRPVRRAAATAGHRPRPGAGAPAAGAGRADRRHPAQYRSRDRRGHQAAERGGGADGAAGGAEAALRARLCQPFPYPGPRAGSRERRHRRAR
ncbi:UNVERIFIED_CONTAM: livG [Trichonephila clavipes]